MRTLSRRAEMVAARAARRLLLPKWKQRDRALRDRARLRFSAAKLGELTKKGVTEIVALPNGTGKPDSIYIRRIREVDTEQGTTVPGVTMPWRKRRTR